MPGKLILVRHGQSTWNVENLFTGWHDVDLSDLGRAEAVQAGRELQAEKLEPNIAFTSVLKRAIRTLWIILDTTDRMWVPIEGSWRLNERHYGALQGLNKAQTVEQHGEAQVKLWRRSYDIPPPPLNLDDPRHPRFDPPNLAAGSRIAEGHPVARTALLGIPHCSGAAGQQKRAHRRARQFPARTRQDARHDVRGRHRGIQYPDRHSDPL